MRRFLIAAALLLTMLHGALAEDVLRATLDNGLRVVIVPDRLAPVVAMNLNYLAGSNDAPEGFPGTAHALEHMMFRGSEGLDRDQVAELGALLGGDNNANTTETVTQYTATVPADTLGVVLRAEALRMRGLILAQADWEQERGAIEQEVSRDLSSPFYNFSAQAQEILFAGTPYQHDALGSRESFDRTDAALLRQFYDRWYAPNNAILVIAGDVKPAEALAQVQAAFGAIPRRDIPAHPAIAPQPVAKAALALPTNFSVGVVALAYRMPGLRAADFAAADVLADVLGSERGALYALVPQGRALMAQFNYHAKPDVGFGLALAAFPKGGDPQPLLEDLRRVLAGYASGDIPAELVEASKRQELAQLAFSNDSIEGLAENWSHALAYRGASAPDDLAQAYSAVTVADVARLAREILNPAHEVSAILTPRGEGQPASGRGYGGTESFAAPPDHPVALPEWAASVLGEPRLPEASAPPDDSVLPNGLRLIVQTEHVSPTVSVFGRVREQPDMQEPPGQEGVSGLTERLFDEGSTAHDRLAFQRAADEITSGLHTGAHFSLRVLTPQFEAGMALLAEGELQPAFMGGTMPARAFTVAQRQMAQSLGGQLQSPDYLFQRTAASAVVPPADPSLRQATPDSVMALHLDDVRAYYTANYRPDLTTIVVIGDVTPAQAREVVLRNFGGWQAHGPTPQVDLPPVGPSRASVARVPDDSSLQDSVWLGQAVPLNIRSPERPALILGNVILGEGFSSRLYRDLRVKTGYVYSVNSSIEFSRTRASYEISFGADGENVDKARQVALGDLAAMQSQTVTDAELNRAKAEILRGLAMRGASVGAIARRALWLAGVGLPLEPARTVAARYVALTAEDIRQAFAAWVRPDDLAMVVKGPP